jgi:predicted transglutaminase-like cysteine proteinase
VASTLALAAPAFDRLASLARERYGTGGGEAVAAWRQALTDAAALPEPDQVARINAFFNRRIHYESDHLVWGRSDYWATPLETLGRGAGDCEDFAIAKYASLAALGVPSVKLRLIYVRAQIGGPASGLVQAHMVLGYYASPSAEPLVLDSLLDEIRPASRRPDLTPIFSFNGEGLWVGGIAPVADPTARLSRWRDLLARMAQEGIE